MEKESRNREERRLIQNQVVKVHEEGKPNSRGEEVDSKPGSKSPWRRKAEIERRGV